MYHFRILLLLIMYSGMLFSQTASKHQVVKKRLNQMTYDLMSSFVKKQTSGKRNFAILNFNNIGEDAQQLHLGESVSEYLNYLISRSSAFQVVERKQIQSLLDEMALQQSGLTGEQAAMDFGKLVGANYIVTGTVAPLGVEFHIVARILEVETGVVSSVALTEIDANHLIAFSSEFFTPKKNKMLAGFLSIVPGMGQFFNDRPKKGGFFLSGFILSMGSAMVFNNFSNEAYNKYQDHSFGSVDQYDKAKNYALYSKAGFWTGISIMGLSMIDAYMEAGSVEKKISEAKKQVAFNPSCFYDHISNNQRPDDRESVAPTLLVFQQPQAFAEMLTGSGFNP